MTKSFMTPFETAQHLSKAAREKRLSLNLSQQSLSKSSGVSFAVIKRFELTGKISLESLLKLALALGNLSDFVLIFKQTVPSTAPQINLATALTLGELLKQKTRKRGRK